MATYAPWVVELPEGSPAGPMGIRCAVVYADDSLTPSDGPDPVTRANDHDVITGLLVDALNASWPVSLPSGDGGNSPPEPCERAAFDTATCTLLSAALAGNDGDALLVAANSVVAFAA